MERIAKRARRGTEYSLYLFAFAAAFSIFLTQFAWAMSALFWLGGMLITQRWEWRRTPLDAAVLLLAAVTLLASLAAVDIGFSPGGILKTLGLMLVFYWACFNLRDSRVVRNSLLAFACGATLNAVFAIGKYAYNITRHGDWTRGSGTHSIPQTFSEILAMGYAFFFALYVCHRPLRRRRWSLLPLVVWPLAIFISHTRGAWLGLAAALLLVGLLISWRRAVIVSLAALALVIGLAAAWNLAHGGGSFYPQVDRLANFFDPERGSNKTRIMIWRAGLKMLEDHPLGVGVDNVIAVYPGYRLEGIPEDKPFGHLHNNFLQILVERGWLGLLAFICILVAAFKALAHRLRAAKHVFGRGLSVGAMGAVTAFLVSGLTEYTFGDSEVVMVFWFILAVGIRDVTGGEKK